MSQSEMEELIKLQKETIESLRQLVENQRLTIESRKLFASSSEKTKTDAISGRPLNPCASWWRTSGSQ